MVIVFNPLPAYFFAILGFIFLVVSGLPCFSGLFVFLFFLFCGGGGGGGGTA